MFTSRIEKAFHDACIEFEQNPTRENGKHVVDTGAEYYKNLPNLDNGKLGKNGYRILQPVLDHWIDRLMKDSTALDGLSDEDRKLLGLFGQKEVRICAPVHPNMYVNPFGNAQNAVSPIILDSNGDGVTTTSKNKMCTLI